MLASVSGHLHAAVEAVAVALDALQAAPAGARVLAAVDQAAAETAALKQDLTAQVLRRMVIEIETCHRAELANSPRLEVALTATRLALQIDPRWV
jgi:sulfur transfer complex TusBCD TusB component (DsrH family)